MSKFTPGPWLRSGRHVYALNDDGYNRMHVSVQDAHTPESELEACALLIAAAPELLSIAERAHDLIAGDLVGAEWKKACHDFTRDARAAIAKATGEQA